MLNSEKQKTYVVTFHTSKVKFFNLENYKTCCRKLVSSGFSIAVSKGRIKNESLFKSHIFILIGPKESFDVNEIILLNKYIKRGGKLLVTDQCGKSSNINLLVGQFGINFRNDSVFRTHRYRNYFHPCEALISDGIVNESIYSMEKKVVKDSHISEYKHFPILYPYGCTLNVKNSSVVLVSTGSVCFPFNRPICAFYKDMLSQGRIVAIGSTNMFSDNYIKKEHNIRLFQIVLNILTDENIRLSLADVQSPDLSDYSMIPNIADLSAFPYCYLQETGEIPFDINLFRSKLFPFDNRYLVKVLQAFKELDVEHKKLRYIKPKFEVPLPSITPASMPPRFRDLTHPALDLMDLDEFFMSTPSRLDRLSFKCTDDDLEYYITECAKAFDIPLKDSKYILHYVCKELCLFKRNRLIY